MKIFLVAVIEIQEFDCLSFQSIGYHLSSEAEVWLDLVYRHYYLV